MDLIMLTITPETSPYNLWAIGRLYREQDSIDKFMTTELELVQLFIADKFYFKLLGLGIKSAHSLDFPY